MSISFHARSVTVETISSSVSAIDSNAISFINTFFFVFRFSYHFTGNRQTNRLDKPEWFFTQILSWAKDNHLFVGTYIQKAFSLANNGETNIRVNTIYDFIDKEVSSLYIYF